MFTRKQLDVYAVGLSWRLRRFAKMKTKRLPPYRFVLSFTGCDKTATLNPNKFAVSGVFLRAIGLRVLGTLLAAFYYIL